MKYKSSQILLNYWNEVRAGRLAPRRLEIEPSRIAGILSETFMLECVDARTFRYRLAGTRLCELFGAELRGANFLTAWSDADRADLERLFSTICDKGAAAVLTLEASTGSGRCLGLEAILLPLQHSGTSITRIIGVMSAASAPIWLHNEPLRDCHLVRHELIWPDGRPFFVIERSSLPAPFTAAGDPRKARPPEQRLFRVLQGGRGESKGGKR